MVFQQDDGVMRFVSVEQRIFETKWGYYAALRESRIAAGSRFIHVYTLRRVPSG